MANRTFISFVALICILLSCTSRTLVIQPIAENTFWEQGREYIHHRDDQLEMMLCYEKQSLDRIVFYLEITNTDSSILHIDPRSFYYFFGGDTADETEKKKPRRIYAKDPEKEIERIEKKIEQENSSYATSSTLDAISGLLSAVGSIVSLFSSNDEKDAADEEEAEEDYDPEQARIEHETIIEALENEKYYWQNDVLRKTTLLQNKYVGGFIEFTFIEDISAFSIQIPVDSSLISFNFKQLWKEL